MRTHPREGARSAVLAIGLTLCSFQAPDEPAVNESLPNIVVIVADDMGYRDLGCYGGTDLETPHIDSLAAEGVRLLQATVASPVCAPMRAGLLTGRYPARYGYETYSGAIEKQIRRDNGVSTDEILLPEVLKECGYRTAAIGKWHLGMNPKYRPLRRGFDHFFGFLSGGHDYYQWDEPPHGPEGGPILRDDEEVHGEGYLPAAFTEEAVGFLRNSPRPFFLYLAYPNPHYPFQAPEEFWPERTEDVRRDQAVAMMQALDHEVGILLDGIREAGIEENTLVLFVNDNGSPYERMNAPFRGRKGTLLEGGVRVAFLAKWPGHLPSGATFDAPATQLDIFPTCVQAAGGELPADREYDGVDLLPFLRGEESGSPHDELFWRFQGSYAMRRGDHKLLLDPSGAASLWNLVADPGESNDLAPEHPDLVASMRKALHAWEARMLEDRDR